MSYNKENSSTTPQTIKGKLRNAFRASKAFSNRDNVHRETERVASKPAPAPQDTWAKFASQETTTFYGQPAITIVAVGDAQVGKTSLLSSFAKQMGMQPSDEENPFRMIQVTGMSFEAQPAVLNLVDTVAGDRVARFRILNYQGCSAFLLMFSLSDRRTFESIRQEWLEEIEINAPQIPIVLVGMKADARQDVEDHISKEEAKKMAWDIKSAGYFEVSTSNPQSMATLFNSVVKLVFRLRAAKVGVNALRPVDSRQVATVVSTQSAISLLPSLQKMVQRIRSSNSFARVNTTLKIKNRD